MKILASFKRSNSNILPSDAPALPFISILLAVYNEEQVIRQKITSTFATDYPKEKIRLLIGSDNSTDLTEKIINEYITSGFKIELFRFESRTGKPGIVNVLAQKTQDEILILTDANIFFTPTTLYELVKHFKNPSIGLVCANVMNPVVVEEGISQQETAYIYRENTLKYQEGLFGCMIGTFGAAYSIRKELYTAVPAGFISDDFFISMKVVEKNKAAILEPNAVCYEIFSSEVSEELKRKSRYAVGNFQNMKYFKNMLWKFWEMKTFCFWSHKVLRWLTPWLILVILASLVHLSLDNKFYKWIGLLTLAGFAAVAADQLLIKKWFSLKLLRFASYFVLMNYALWIGSLRFMFSKPSNIWDPTKRV
jgi:cellulose synthase/poly-beta-1,6-N-acetylglucosamine synthase-like glycosyltransferase